MDAAGVDWLGTLSEQAFLAAGAALYAGEGSKTDRSVNFANSDGPMVAFFFAWLRHFFDIDESRLRVRLYLHPGLDLDAAVGVLCSRDRHPAPPVQLALPGGAGPEHPAQQA